MKLVNHVTALLALSALAVSCTKAKKDDAAELPAKPVNEQPITAQKSAVGILDVRAELRDDGLMVHLGAIPGGSTVECDMDGKPLVPCHDGALFGRPAAGDHKITAVALRSGAITALGESTPFTVAPGAGAVVDVDTTGGSLALAIDDATFSNGMTVPLTKDFALRFKLAGKPTCDKPLLRCKYDSRSSQFWTACDKDDKSFTVSKDLLALGLQYLSIQASCAEQMGPVLTTFWYGVPDGYVPMLLKDLKDSSGRHIINLVKADDCPESQQKFECAATSGDEFALCQNGNVLDQPQAGYRVRLACADRQGPVLTIAN